MRKLWARAQRAWRTRRRTCQAGAALVLLALAWLAFDFLRPLPYIDKHYRRVCRTAGDINQHLPTIYHLAQECNTVAEFGVRSVVSTFALLKGLRDSRAPLEASISSPGKEAQPRRLLCLDVSRIWEFQRVVPAAAEEGVNVTVVQHDSATFQLPWPVDMLFIDTWHVYGHLKRELAQHSGMVRKYIVMHDTEIDGEEGESIRNADDDLPWYNTNITEQAQQSGYPEAEITRGLRPAIDEFLEAHSGEWVLHKRYRNNNGLTILRRIKKRAAD